MPTTNPGACEITQAQFDLKPEMPVFKDSNTNKLYTYQDVFASNFPFETPVLTVMTPSIIAGTGPVVIGRKIFPRP